MLSDLVRKKIYIMYHLDSIWLLIPFDWYVIRRLSFLVRYKFLTRRIWTKANLRTICLSMLFKLFNRDHYVHPHSHLQVDHYDHSNHLISLRFHMHLFFWQCLAVDHRKCLLLRCLGLPEEHNMITYIFLYWKFDYHNMIRYPAHFKDFSTHSTERIIPTSPVLYSFPIPNIL